MVVALLTIQFILLNSTNTQFYFLINDTPYVLELTQNNFHSLYQFAEHTSDGNIWVLDYSQHKRLTKIDHYGNIIISPPILPFPTNIIYTTKKNSLLSINLSNRILWRFDNINQQWDNSGIYMNWLGTWGIDEKDGTIIIAEYCQDTDPFARVFRSKTDGKTWDIVFYQRARGSESPQVRHFHTLQVDPYTGEWYLSSGDHWSESKVWKSKDDGDTWIDVTDYNLYDIPPQIRTQSLFRLTSFWFTPEYICWATDDKIKGHGAHLVISPRTEPLDIQVLGRVSYNEVRSATEFPDIGWLLTTENKSGYIGIEFIFITKDFGIIPLGILEGIADNFSASIASKKADWVPQEKCWVAYSLARGLIPRIMRYKLKRNFKLEITQNDTYGGEVIVTPYKGWGYEEGDIVQIQVKENAGYIFTGWEGDYVTSKKILTITITKDTQLKAHFYPIDIEPDYKIPAYSYVALFTLFTSISLLASFYIKKYTHS